MTPRFDTNMLFTTVDALLRSLQPATPSAVTAQDPVRLYFDRQLLITLVAKTVTDMQRGIRAATKLGQLTAEDQEQLTAELDRRRAYIKELRALKGQESVYIALYPVSEHEAAAEGPSWN